GNEAAIKELADTVLGVLMEHELVQLPAEPGDAGQRALARPTPGADLDQLRGTWMFLLLNSANGDVKLDVWGPQCVHLLQQLPAPLPQFVSVAVALFAGLDQQLLEFLACGPLWLAAQYYDCLNDTLGHVVSDKRAALPHVCGALSAVTKSICYHALAGDIGGGGAGTGGGDGAATLVGNAQRLLQRHLLDSEERVRALRAGSARHRYLGEALRQLLDVLLEAVRALELPPQLPDYYAIYALRMSARATPLPEEVLAKLRLFAGKLLDAVQRLLALVSVDTYMAWHDLPSGQLLMHLQAHVCNQSHELLRLLREDEVLVGHSVLALLQNFADGAQSFKQRLVVLTLGELLGLLDGEMGVVTEQQLRVALEELLQRPIAYGNEECVETMAKHVKLMGMPHARRMLHHLAEAMQLKLHEQQQDEEEEEEDQDLNDMYGELLRLLLQPIFKGCQSFAEKLQFLQQRDELQLLDHYRFELQDFHARRVYFFNQLGHAPGDFPMLQFLDLCYEQPGQTWLALAELAMSHRRYTLLYGRIALRCRSHAINHVDATVQRLMLQERHGQPSQALVRLYETPVILGGMLYHQMQQLRLNLALPAPPYTADQLAAAHGRYLCALADGLAKFSEARNYPALEHLVWTLLQLEQVEQHLTVAGKRSLQRARQQLAAARRATAPQEQVRHRLRLARAYVALHARLPLWRAKHWPLHAQLLRTMDDLRGDLDNFSALGLSLLDKIMDYY
ncbi:hypothetical protein KR222_004779, partial [Zaprionus bogoriensis]